MQEFHFQGRNLAGKAVEGRRFALSADLIAQQLQNEGIIPVSIRPYKESISWRHLIDNLRRPVKLEEIMLLCRQLFALNKAGIPITSAVKRLIETTRNPSMKQALQNVFDRLNVGESLSVAMTRHPQIFSALFVNLVQVGENSGTLETSFQQLSQYFSLEENTVRRVKTVTRYPIFVIVALAVALVVINLFVIPAFAKLFEKFQAQLPLPTRILIATSNFLIHHWGLLLFGVVALAAGLVYYVKTTAGRLRWHTWQRRLPIVGPIIGQVHMIRFARTFSMVFKAGIPITEGLRLTANAIGNDFVKQKILDMRIEIERGTGLTKTAGNSQLFSPLTIQMISVGEETGYLAEMLEEIAEFYEREVDYDLTKLGDALEPILLIGIGIMVLILALGVFLPMWDIARLAQNTS